MNKRKIKFLSKIIPLLAILPTTTFVSTSCSKNSEVKPERIQLIYDKPTSIGANTSSTGKFPGTLTNKIYPTEASAKVEYIVQQEIEGQVYVMAGEIRWKKFSSDYFFRQTYNFTVIARCVDYPNIIDKKDFSINIYETLDVTTFDSLYNMNDFYDINFEFYYDRLGFWDEKDYTFGGQYTSSTDPKY